MSSYDLPISMFPQTSMPTSRFGHDEGWGEPPLIDCPREDPFTYCGINGGFSGFYSWSFADMVQPIKDYALAYGQHPPEYCTFSVALKFGSVFPAFRDCKNGDTTETNGWCDDHDWGGTDSFLQVSGGTGEWVAPAAHDYGFVDTTVSGNGPISLTEPQAEGTWQQGTWWEVLFQGEVINPSPPSEIPIPSEAYSGPSYGGSRLFPIDEPPADLIVVHNVSGTNFPDFHWSMNAVGYYNGTSPPPPPDPGVKICFV